MHHHHHFAATDKLITKAHTHAYTNNGAIKSGGRGQESRTGHERNRPEAVEIQNFLHGSFYHLSLLNVASEFTRPKTNRRPDFYISSSRHAPRAISSAHSFFFQLAFHSHTILNLFC